MSQTFLFLEAIGFKLITIILQKSIEKEASATHVKLNTQKNRDTASQHSGPSKDT